MWNSSSSDGYFDCENDEMRIDVAAAEDAAAAVDVDVDVEHRDIDVYYHLICCAVDNTWSARMR